MDIYEQIVELRRQGRRGAIATSAVRDDDERPGLVVALVLHKRATM
jgi:hypothetical protein